MSTEKKTDFSADAEAAVQLEAAAKAGPDVTSYTHTFEKPFEFRGRTVTELTFNWGALTGEDHEAIEGDMLRHGQTLVVPATTGPYLTGMAVRACTNRDDNGIRILDDDFLKAMPFMDYQKSFMSARRFLLRSGS